LGPRLKFCKINVGNVPRKFIVQAEYVETLSMAKKNMLTIDKTARFRSFIVEKKPRIFAPIEKGQS